MYNKGIRKTPEELIQFALDQEIPPLYITREINGVIVKYYPFIGGHSKIKKHEIPAMDMEQKDYSLLSAYKSELENQLELNYKYCIDEYTLLVKSKIREWLEDKFARAGWPLDSKEGKRGQFDLLVTHINTLIFRILRGVEGRVVIKYLKSLQIPFSKTLFDTPAKYNDYREEYESIISNISELLDKINWPLKNIERVVSRSVDLYFEYLDIHSNLYDFNPEEMLVTNKIEKLIKTFVREKFEPKTHDKQMIEDYLIRWEQNQGLGYPRKTTVDELKSDYPKLGKIYNSSSSVIFNWEERWKKYKDARTEK